MDLHNPIFSAGESLSGVYLQGLQIAFLRVAEQGGDAMIVPHAANVGVSPQREDLTDDGHPPQRAVNQFHDVRVTHLLRKKTTRGGFSLSSISKHSGVCFIILWFFFFLHSETSRQEDMTCSFCVEILDKKQNLRGGLRGMCPLLKQLKYQMIHWGGHRIIRSETRREVMIAPTRKMDKNWQRVSVWNFEHFFFFFTFLLLFKVH